MCEYALYLGYTVPSAFVLVTSCVAEGASLCNVLVVAEQLSRVDSIFPV